MPALGPKLCAHVVWELLQVFMERGQLNASEYSREALRSTFAEVPEQKCRQLFAGVAADVYGFDLEALTPVAQEIGPKVTEIAEPLTAEELPPSNSGAFAGVFSLSKTPLNVESSTDKT